MDQNPNWRFHLEILSTALEILADYETCRAQGETDPFLTHEAPLALNDARNALSYIAVHCELHAKSIV